MDRLISLNHVTNYSLYISPLRLGTLRVLFLLVREYRFCFSNLAVLVFVAPRVKMGSVFCARRVPWCVQRLRAVCGVCGARARTLGRHTVCLSPGN